MPRPKARPGDGRRTARPLALAALLAGLLGMLHASGAVAQVPGSPFGPPPALSVRTTLKLSSTTLHANRGEAGYLHEGDDTRSEQRQSLRVQARGAAAGGDLRWQVDYFNVLETLTEVPSEEGPPVGVQLYRRQPWRQYWEKPRTTPREPATNQRVRWFHELDRAEVSWRGGWGDAILGRQPISFGTGRIWQPTDLFAPFGALALDTEFKPGVDAAVLRVYPGPLSSLTAAYVLSSAELEATHDSAVLHFRGPVGEDSEVTALGGRWLNSSAAGGSVETIAREAGWRLEVLGLELPEEERRLDDAERAAFAIAGVDYGFDDGTLVVLEAYHNSLGAAEVAKLSRVAASDRFLDGRLPHLSRNLLGLSAERDLTGLWRGTYTGLLSALEDAEKGTQVSGLHQLRATYSISDEAVAVFALARGIGRSLDKAGRPRSEFGHVPDALTMEVRLTF